MLKSILNLEGAQELTRNEQKSINGGVTAQCNIQIMDGYCVRKGSNPCPADYPNMDSGGCCCQEL